MNLKIESNINLSDFSTFKIGGSADFFTKVKDQSELSFALDWAGKNKKKVFVLGGGSKTIFSDQGFSGLVIKNEMRGIKVMSENEDSSIVRVFSGETWSRFINFSIENNLYGLENTFYIPGTVGAAPIQNIGAYGAEMKDCFHNLMAINIETREKKYFNLQDCEFSYRDSIFKGKLKNKYFIVWVDFRLKKKADLKLNYPDIQKALNDKNIPNPSLKELTEIIREIRDSKLPNPAVLPNSGSFFKNPIISLDSFDELKERFPEIKSFPDNNGVKIPAGWLIEQCGFKGRQFGQVGVYEKQALIIVNHGGAKQSDVVSLVENIKMEVKNKFGIILEEEVNVL